MPFESTCFNLGTGRWHLSPTGPEIADYQVTHGNIRDFGVTFIWPDGVAVESIAGVTLYLSDPLTPNDVMTSAPAGAAANNQYPFLLPVSGTDIDTFMPSSVTEPKAATAEFKFATSGGGENSYKGVIYIAPKQGTPATVIPIPDDPYLTVSAGTGMFTTKIMPVGGFIIWPLADGRQFKEYMHPDGTKHCDEI